MVFANLSVGHMTKTNSSSPGPFVQEPQKRYARALTMRLLTSLQITGRVCNTELYVLLVNTMNRVFQ